MYTTDFHVMVRQEQIQDAIREADQAKQQAALLAEQGDGAGKLGIVAWPRLAWPWVHRRETRQTSQA